MENICRLCSIDKDLVHMFNEPRAKNLNMMRQIIFLATGVEIKETDIVSQMVCHRCCEVAIKLHKYRTNAISNDKLLKEQYGQPYTPPISNQEEMLYLAAKIASERIIALNQSGNISNSSNFNNNLLPSSNQSGIESYGSLEAFQTQNTASNNKDFTEETFQDKNSSDEISKHESVRELHDQSKSIILPIEVFNSDVSPEISLNDEEVTDWYSEQASRIQSQLTSVVIEKVPSASTIDSSSTSTISYDVIPSLNGETEVSKTITAYSSANIPDSNRSVSVNSNSLDMDDLVPSSRDENNASRLNSVSNIILNTEYLNQESKRKRGRPPQLLKKRGRPPKWAGKRFSDDDDGDEVIPEKKIRRFKNKTAKNALNKIDLPSQLPYDKTQQKTIFTSSLELVPTGSSASSTISAPSPSSLYSETAPASPSSLMLNSFEPSVYDPEGILLIDHADRQHIMAAEKTLSVFICLMCNKLCDSKKELTDHEKVHLKCKFCKMKVNSIDALNKHLNQSCFINVVKNLPDLKLTKVDLIPEVVEKYPEAFGLPPAVEYISCNLNENGITVKSESDSQFIEYSQPEVYTAEKPAINSNNAQKDKKKNSNKQNKTTEVEVISLTDESDDEVECVDVDDVSESNQDSISPKELGEKGVIHSLFKKFHSFKSSNPANLPKNDIKCNDANYIVLDNFMSELEKYNVLVYFQPDSRISARFEEKPLWTQRTILEKWADKKVIEVRSPYVSYNRSSIKITKDPLFINKQLSNNLSSKTTKQATISIPTTINSNKVSSKTTKQATISIPTIVKVTSLSSTNNTSTTATDISNTNSLNKLTAVESSSTSDISNKNTNVIQDSPTITLVTNTVTSNDLPQPLNASTVIPCQIVPHTNVVGLQNENVVNGNQNTLLLLAPTSMLQMPTVTYLNSSPQSTQNQASPSGQITQESTENSIPLANVKPIIRVKDLQELTGGNTI